MPTSGWNPFVFWLPLEKYDTFLHVDIRGVITFSMVEKEGLLLHAGKVELNAAFV